MSTTMMTPAPSRVRVLAVMFTITLACAVLAGGCSQTSAQRERAAGAGTADNAAGRAAGTPGAAGIAANLADPPVPNPEFRGMFVATANNLDWPSRPSLHRRVQKDEINATVARAKDLNCNVILLQVRAFGDRIHRNTTLATDSKGKYKNEPWAQAIAYGNDPDPNPTGPDPYDPLADWVDACHAAGLELHIWINPFRIHSLVKIKPDPQVNQEYYLPIAAKFNKQLYLKPSSKAVQDYVHAVIDDLLENYPPPPDVVVHIEGLPGQPELAAAAMMMSESGPTGVIFDHQNPPPDKDGLPGPGTQPSTQPSTSPTGGRTTNFQLIDPKIASGGAAGAKALSANQDKVIDGTSPKLIPPKLPPKLPVLAKSPAEARVDWLIKTYNDNPQLHLPNDTQANVEVFIDQVTAKVRKEKLRFGLSPKVDDTTAKTRLSQEKLDYVIPELYALRGPNGATFKNDLKDWLNHIPNTADPPIVVAGLYSARVQTPEPQDDEPWPADEIVNQMEDVRTTTGDNGKAAAGDAHFSGSALRTAKEGGPGEGANGDKNLGKRLKEGEYKSPRIGPKARSAPGNPPGAPKVWTEDIQGQRWAKWDKGPGRNPKQWAVWTRSGGAWSDMQIVGRDVTAMKIDAAVNAVRVVGIDRFNRAGPFGRWP